MTSGQTETHTACITAIRDQLIVEFDYQGHHRVVVPMAVGADSGGSLKLRGQQIGGTSSSGRPDPDHPRLFFLGQITDMTVTETGFETPSSYTKNDSALERIDAQL